MKIALAQMNTTVGDLEGNREKIHARILEAAQAGAQIAVFPELAVTGYPPEDLLLKRSFIDKAAATLKGLAHLTKGLTVIVGFPDRDSRGHVRNAAAILSEGKVVACYHKMALPNYGVFDEKRYFTPGKHPLVLEFSDLGVGVSVCEDIWVKESSCKAEAAAGARILINISASPYHAGRLRERENLLIRRAKELKSWICYVNLVGGQDELIFDGGSLVVDPKGKIVFRAPQFEEGLFMVEIPSKKNDLAPPLSPEAEVFQALVLGVRDYCAKNGFSRVVMGLSGGVDSALTACIASAALGKEKVTVVSMPSRYSSAATRADARALASNLGIRFLELPIEKMFQAALETLRSPFGNRPIDVTEENLQARIRGTLLMAISNKFGWLVLATGNKSELSTGYCTLYGDMVGGFAVIKDLPKAWVYRLSRHVNRSFGKETIPVSIIDRAPTAELKPNQRDQDTLPPYERLDAVVRAYVEEDKPLSAIKKGVRAPKGEIERVVRMIDSAEYKRRQAPIGIKITPRAFGKDRRMPITNKYRDS